MLRLSSMNFTGDLLWTPQAAERKTKGIVRWVQATAKKGLLMTVWDLAITILSSSCFGVSFTWGFPGRFRKRAVNEPIISGSWMEPDQPDK